MKRNYVELFFRHRLLLLAPLVIAFMLGAGWGLMQPRTYVAGATMWTDAPLPNDSTVANVEAAPSTGQQSLLNELLATRKFLLAVANDSPMRHEVATLSPPEVDYALRAMA